MTPELRELVQRWVATYDSRRTRDAYRIAIEKLWRYWRGERTTAAVVEATIADVQAALASWSESARPAARYHNLVVSAWCKFFAFLRDEGHRDGMIYLRRRPVPNKPTRDVPTSDEVAAVWAMLEHPSLATLPPPDLQRVRHDRALFALLLVGGLRRCEVVRLDVSDIEDNGGEVIVVQVRRGKRGKSRTVGLPGTGDDGARLRRILADVIHGRGPEEPLLLAANGNRIGERAAIDRLAHLFERATSKRYTPHCLRAWFATSALHRGVPITVLAEQLGHSSIETTRGYDQLRHKVVALGSLT